MLPLVPGMQVIEIDPQLVLVILLPPLLFDCAWTIAAGRLRRHLIGIAALAIRAVFGSDLSIAACNALGLGRYTPTGPGAATVLSWAGVRGVVTLALALRVSESFPDRDLIFATSSAAILGNVLFQGTTLGKMIAWAGLSEPASEKARLTMSQAEMQMAQAQLVTVQGRA